MGTINKEFIIEKYGSQEAFKAVHLDMIDRFFKWVKKYDLKIFLAFGGYLGYVRENRLIGWDHDIDVAILAEHLPQLTDEVYAGLKDFGFIVPDLTNSKFHYIEDKFNGEYFRIFNEGYKSRSCELIEIFPLKPDETGKKVWFKFWYKKNYAEKSIYEKLIWVDFLGTKVQIPCDHNNCLVHQYNEKWKFPKRSKKYILIDKDYQDLIDNRLKEMNLYTTNEISEFFNI